MTMTHASGKPDNTDAALDLHERGFSVIPLGDPYTMPPAYMVKESGEGKAREEWPKTPRIPWKEFQTRDATEAEIRQWWKQWPTANIGIATGRKVNVVDADNAEAVQAVLNSPDIGDTLYRVKTRRGEHFYFAENPALAVRNHVGNKLDIRGIGGYVVAAGSTAFDGTIYEWTHEAPHTVAELPEITHKAVAAVRGYGKTTTGELNIDLSTVSLGPTTAPVAEGGRNNAAASLAGKYIDQGYALTDVANAVLEWNKSNNPPLPEGEIGRTVASVAQTHTMNHPDKPIMFAPPPQAAEEELKVYTMGELIDNPPPLPEFFWRGAALFRGCRFMLAGGPKAGKSNLFLAMAVAAASGGEFLGSDFEKPIRVCWIQAEIQDAFLHERLSRMICGLGPALEQVARDNLMMTGRVYKDLANPYHLAVIKRTIARHKPDIICFDPIINFSTAAENDNVEVHKLLHILDELGHENNCAVVAVHHTNKSTSDDDAFNSIRGASAFRGWYDTGLMLTRSGSSILAHYEMRNAESLPVHGLDFNSETGRYYREVLEDESAQLSEEAISRIAQIYRAIENSPDGIKGSELMVAMMESMSISRTTYYRTLDAAVEQFGIQHTPSGSHDTLYHVKK